MADVLFDRYKDALRRGHVAALRGQLDVALGAYEEASAIAPDRPLPLTSLAGIHRRLGQDDEALRMFDRASDLVPDDLAVALGRAECLAALGRRAAAAAAFAAIAEAQAAAGHPPEAEGAALRVLELAAARDQRGSIGRLVDRLRNVDADDEALSAVARRAQRVLEAAAVRPVVDGSSDGGAVSGADREPEAPLPDAGTVDASGGVLADRAPADGDAAVAASDLDPVAGVNEAVRQLDEGDPAAALATFRAVASVHRREGRVGAALDACTQALAIKPTDAAIHLDLVDLYVDAGWSTLAADKIRLVARLAELDGDGATRDRLCAVVGARFGDDPELVALCA